MKKLLCAVLAVIMLFMLVACGSDKETETSPADETTVMNEAEKTTKENKEETEKPSLSSFTADTLEGEKADQSIFEGKKVTMLNIWATFCGPCINEMPDLQKLHEDYADKGFQVVGIVCDIYETNGVFDEGDLNLAKDIVKNTGVKYTSLLPSSDLKEAKINDVSSVPETIFVNEKGEVIAGPYIGSKSYDQWAKIIDGVLEKA